jgi:hypothetical protein
MITRSSAGSLSALLAAFASSALLAACHNKTVNPIPPLKEVPGTQVMMEFHRSDFFDSPFPSEDRRLPDGGIDMSLFRNPTHNAVVNQLLTLGQQANGFGRSSTIFLRTTAALQTTGLPDYHGSVQPGANIFLIGVDSSAPDYLKRYPVSVSFAAANGPYGNDNLIAMLPLQGIPMRSLDTYAAVVMRSTLDAQGQKLGVSLPMVQLAAGVKPDGLGDAAYDAYQKALSALVQAGINKSDIAGLAVFRTWDPTVGMRQYIADVLAKPLPQPITPFTRNEEFDDYCVYQTTINMPEYQTGTPPYDTGGGEWGVDANGAPQVQRQETAAFVVTVPRQAMPPAGFPVVLFSRTGGGGNRPLVDRGTQATEGGPPITPGSGPALFFAMAGWGGAEIEGPLGGLRNPTGDPTGNDEQTLIFNVDNPGALRDNIRQSALEMVLNAHVLEQVRINASDCDGVITPDGGPVQFDVNSMAIMGHSMGATISPLAFALEPRFRAAVFSGEGGSWIENVIYKQNPFVVLPLANLLLDIPSDYTLNEHDPLLAILQWTGEPSDPPLYAPLVNREPVSHGRHVLMEQGIVDTYILPPIANASSLSFGLDLAGPEYDATTPALSQFTPISTLLDLSGHSAITLPAQGNETAGDGTTVTAMVIQHQQDSVEDGHEVVFQTDAPKHQYRCFLQTLLTGIPKVPPDGAATDPCP